MKTVKKGLAYISSLNWTKDDLKKFIFFAGVILLAAIIFRIIPLKIVIDTNAMWPGSASKVWKKPYPFRINADVSGYINTDTNINGSVEVEPSSALGFHINNY